MGTERPTLVLMAGPPGAGKSSLALAISKVLRWPVIDKDTLKSTALDAQVPEAVAGKLSYALMFQIGEDLVVRQQLSVILDSPAAYPVVLEWADETARLAPAELKVILCVTDRRTRNHRLTERVARPSQWLADTSVDEGIWRGLPAFFPKDTCILSTDRPLSALVAASIDYLKS